MAERGGVVAAAIVPGMPQLLARSPADSWRDLRLGVEQVGERFLAAGVETVVLLSTQWFTVLGHQGSSNLRGNFTSAGGGPT